MGAAAVISQDTFFGGAHAQALPLAYRLTPMFKRFYALRAGASGLSATVENPTTLPTVVRPGLVMTVMNVGTGGQPSFEVRDHAANVLATLDPGDAVELYWGWSASAAWDASGSGEWRVRPRVRA